MECEAVASYSLRVAIVLAGSRHRHREELSLAEVGILADPVGQTCTITSDAFCPPKPKLLEMAFRNGFSRAVLGT
jgi:hypothetical protein